jgi:hypothetical protein
MTLKDKVGPIDLSTVPVPVPVSSTYPVICYRYQGRDTVSVDFLCVFVWRVSLTFHTKFARNSNPISELFPAGFNIVVRMYSLFMKV